MFKKYISKMWLMSYKEFTFEDSERINNLRAERLKRIYDRNQSDM